MLIRIYCIKFVTIIYTVLEPKYQQQISDQIQKEQFAEAKVFITKETKFIVTDVHMEWQFKYV